MMRITAGPHGPQIDTERLRLRLHRLTDLDARATMTRDPQTMQFVGGPQDYEENFSRLLRYAGHWTLLSHGVFLVEERASGRIVGEAGLADFRRGLGQDFDGFPEAAWMIAAPAVGQGYATEAVTAAIAWHEQVFGPGRKVCIIDPGNAPSLQVAAKLGFAPFGNAIFKDRQVILHERLSSLSPSRVGRARQTSC